MKNNNSLKRLLTYVLFVFSLFIIILGVNEKVFAEDEPAHLPADDKILNLFDWGQNWQKNGAVTYKGSTNPYKKRVGNSLRKPMEFWGEYEISAQVGDTYSSFALGSYQPSVARAKGTPNKGTWFDFPKKVDWTISDSKKWQNLPVTAPGFDEKRDGFLASTYTATYNLPVTPIEFEGWPNDWTSTNGVHILNIPQPDKNENANDKSVRYEFNDKQKGPAKAKYYMTGEYDDSGVVFSTTSQNPSDAKELKFVHGTNHIMLVPQLVKVTYRDVDTLAEIKGLSPQTLGKKGSWKNEINATGLDKTIKGYNNIGFQVVSGAYLDNTYVVSKYHNGAWSTAKQSKVSKLEKAGSKKIIQNNEQQGIVVWLEKEKANAKVSKKVSKQEVSMEADSQTDDYKINKHREVEYSVSVINSKYGKDNVSTLEDYTLVDELPQGIRLKTPLKVERVGASNQKIDVPEKKDSRNKKPYYEVTSKVDSVTGKTKQVVTISGTRIQVGQQDEFCYTALLEEGKHDEVKTNKATVTAPNSDPATGTASFKVLDKAKLSTIKRVKNLTENASADYASSVEAKEKDKLQYTVRVANSALGDNPGTGLLNEVKVVDKMPDGLSNPTNIQEVVDGKRHNVPEKSKATASDKIYYEWNQQNRELTIVENSPLKVGLMHVFYYDTTVTERSSKRENVAKATSPGLADSEGKATVTMANNSNPLIKKEAFKWKEDGKRGDNIKSVKAGEEFSYSLFGANEKAAEGQKIDWAYNIVYKDILPENLAAPTNVRMDPKNNTEEGSLVVPKTSENQTGRYYEWNEKTRELTVTLGSGYALPPSGAGYSVTFDTKLLKGNPGDKIVNTATLHTESDKVPEVKHTLEVTKDWQVTYHTKEKWIDRTSPKPNPETVADGNKATKPKRDPIGREYHDQFKRNNPNAPDANADPVIPIRAHDVRSPDMIFDGWYTDEGLKNKYNFDTPVHSDINLYAKWKPNPSYGMFQKAFDRETLEKTHDNGPYKAPGNELKDVYIGQTFSYMSIARNSAPNRDDIQLQSFYHNVPLEESLPQGLSKPSKVEIFTIDAEWKDGENYQQITDYSTLKTHMVKEKSEVTSTETEEYYEITQEPNGQYKLVINNLKQNKLIGAQYYGFIFETKLEKRPVLKENDYKISNRSNLTNKNHIAFTFNKDGSFTDSSYTVVAYSNIHVPWKVDFESNGGDVKPKDQFVRNTEKSEEPKDKEVPKRAGYTFEGWYEDKELTKKFDFKNTPIEKDTTLYAKWDEVKKWKVTYHTEETWIKRTAPDPNPEWVYDGEKATKPKKTPIGKKYHVSSYGQQYDADDPLDRDDKIEQNNKRTPDQIFVGWYVDKDFTKEYNFNDPVTKDTDIYAKWKPNQAVGLSKKAFKRDTLTTEHDNGRLKAPGNMITDVKIGETFSYMGISRNTNWDRDNGVRAYYRDLLPNEIEDPTKVEIFTLQSDPDKDNGYGYPTLLYDTLQVYEVPEKSKVASVEKDEHYEIVRQDDGTRYLELKNMKHPEVIDKEFTGMILETKLKERPKINSKKEYIVNNKMQFDDVTRLTFLYKADGEFEKSKMTMVSTYGVHVPWKVEFEPNGGTPKPKDQFVRNMSEAEEPKGDQIPEKAGYAFKGWYEDKELTKKFDFKTPIEKDWILYAKWEKNQPYLALDKTANKKVVKVGETVSYTLTMKNMDENKLEDAKLVDVFPEGMSEPKNIKLDGAAVSEGKSNANSDGAYYTWDQSKMTLTLYYNELAGKAEKKLTYDSKVLSGKPKEEKTNRAEFSGSNSINEAIATYTLTIVGKKAMIHVKQEIINKHEDIVVPKTGYLKLDHVKKADPDNKKNQVTLTMPSYEVDTNKAYKDLELRFDEDYTNYLPKEIEPEYYQYDGYQLTTDNGNHRSANKKTGKMPSIDLSEHEEYWLTVYMKPKTSEDGPAFYNWDSKINDFGKIQMDRPMTVKIKFYSRDNDKGKPTRHLDFRDYPDFEIVEKHPNLKDYYYKMEMPDGSGMRRFKLGETFPELPLKSKEVVDGLPKEVPIKMYFTNKSGKEEESFDGISENGIDGNMGRISTFKIEKKDVEINQDQNEIIVWYYYSYTASEAT